MSLPAIVIAVVAVAIVGLIELVDSLALAMIK
jgi:hypothetical protein